MTDEQTEALKRFNDEQAKIVAEYVRKSNIAELEKIKAEFEDIILLNQTVAIKIMDKHISYLKGDKE